MTTIGYPIRGVYWRQSDFDFVMNVLQANSYNMLTSGIISLWLFSLIFHFPLRKSAVSVLDYKTVRIFAYSNTREQSETKGLKRGWKRRARVGRITRATLPILLRFEKKAVCFGVYFGVGENFRDERQNTNPSAIYMFFWLQGNLHFWYQQNNFKCGATFPPGGSNFRTAINN